MSGVGRFVVTLRNGHGVTVSTADFESEEAALNYLEQAKVSAEEIGGSAEMDPPPVEDPKR
jgi:hypothetical protein